MPRINANVTSASGTFSIPYKALGLVALIACGVGYIVYQFERLHPAPQKQTGAKTATAQDKRAMFEKLNLDGDQLKKLAALQLQTTDPKMLRREAAKVLTPEQLAKLKDLKTQTDSQRAEEQAKRQQRMAKYFPGDQLKTAQGMNQQIKERIQARRDAANSTAGASPTSKP